MPTTDAVLALLTRLGLQESRDAFTALLMPWVSDPDSPSQYETAVGLIGILMRKAGFSDSLVMLVVRDLIKTDPEIIVEQPQCSVVSFDGVLLYVPIHKGGNWYNIQTRKPVTINSVDMPLTATTFSLAKAFQLAAP